jgi:hypothetical protein
VGIGTASPSSLFKLDINGVARATTEIRSKNTAGNISYFTFEENGNTNSATFISGDARTTGNMGLWTNSLERMRLTSTGNALIGTTTDNGVDKLQVSGSAIASTLKVNTSGQTVNISSYYNGGVGKNIWIGGGGLSSTSGEQNTSIGVDALLNNTSGYYNTAVGSSALKANTSGYVNDAFGLNALIGNTTGYRNVAFGSACMQANTTGFENMAVGHLTLTANTTGTKNVGIGAICLANNTTGSSNIAFGQNAGTFVSGGGNLTTPSQSIFIGEDTRPSANGNTNEMVFGHTAIGQGSNTVTLGNSSITKTFLRGNTMINTNTDNGVDKLQVSGSIYSSTTLKGNDISIVGSGSIPTLTSSEFITQSFSAKTTAKTANYTTAFSDYFIDCTSGTFTVTLQAASSYVGRILIIKNSGAGTITVDANASETIDGSLTYSLSLTNSTVQIMSDGTNWKIIAKF